MLLELGLWGPLIRRKRNYVQGIVSTSDDIKRKRNEAAGENMREQNLDQNVGIGTLGTIDLKKEELRTRNCEYQR